MSYDTEVKALLARHDGMSDAQITLALIMARLEQVYGLQVEARVAVMLPQDKAREVGKMQRVYLELLDASLAVVRNPMAGIFPNTSSGDDEAP